MVTEKDYADYAMTANLLDAFGCDSKKAAYYDFAELVYKMRLKLRKNPENTSIISEIVMEMCKTKKIPRRFFYHSINCVIAPLLAADDDFWETLGGKKPRKMTAGYVALYLAQIFEKMSS